MNNIRIKFGRGEEVKYISHLDLMKTFERSIRRSRIPIAYSQGFNPHPQMVFGLPLSVGVSSQAEYGDFELTGAMSPADFTAVLNNELPTGLEVFDAKTKETKDNIMASIGGATYDILLSADAVMEEHRIHEKIAEFMLQPSITVKKEGKKGIKDVDIKSMIFKIEVKDLTRDADSSSKYLDRYIKGLTEKGTLQPSYSIDNIFCLSTLLSAGSAANLKPELLVSAFSGFVDAGVRLVKIHRTGLFVNKEGNLLDPLDDSILYSK